MHKRGFTLLELLGSLGVIITLLLFLIPTFRKFIASASMATSASNIRSLSVGAAQYLADHDHKFWSFCETKATLVDSEGNMITGSRWWFGFESAGSLASGEGHRSFDPDQGPLAGYVPKGIRPDPAFTSGLYAFKAKYKCGYIAIGYNAVLAGGWATGSRTKAMSYWDLTDPGKVVVFATCAQVNNFQSPATADHPMLEEFYGFDQYERTIHFREGNMAMVAFADGSCGFLPIDESTRDSRMPEANIGRFAPRGSFTYLK